MTKTDHIEEDNRLKQNIEQNEVRYREIFNKMNNCIAVYKPVENGTDFIFVDFNRAAELTDQISKEELIGKKVTEVFTSVEEFGLLDIMKKVTQSGEMEKHPISQYIDDRISGWRDNYVYKLPTGEILVIYSDITRQKQDEDTSASQLKLLQMAGESAKLGGWSVDLDKNLCTWSDQVADIHEVPHGYSPPVEEGIRFYAPEYQQKIKQVFTDCVQKGIPYDEEMQIITNQGERVWVRTVGEAVRDEDGKIVRVQGSFQDISVQKEAQEALRVEREQLLALFDSIEQAIYVSDPKSYEIIFVNKYMRNLFDEDPIGGICYQVFQGLDKPCEFCTNEIIFQEIEKPYTWEYYNPLLDRDFLITDKAICWIDDRDVRFEIAIDITKQKQAEKELRVLKDSLEQQVAEKTKELQERVQELERFHDATVAREIRMKELRDEIKRLKGETNA
jgi:PAS domain S-box-containing protein